MDDKILMNHKIRRKRGHDTPSSSVSSPHLSVVSKHTSCGLFSKRFWLKLLKAVRVNHHQGFTVSLRQRETAGPVNNVDGCDWGLFQMLWPYGLTVTERLVAGLIPCQFAALETLNKTIHTRILVLMHYCGTFLLNTWWVHSMYSVIMISSIECWWV